MRSTDSTAKRIQALRKRICRFEEIEPREFLSATPYEAPAPINVGIVYHEDYYTGFQSGQEDAGGDTFVIAWNGGAGNTTLDKIVIDLNKVSGAGSDAKISFNPDGAVRPNGYGTFYPFDYNLESNADNGITANATLSLDGKQLVIDFTGFTAGKKFYFKIDADEYHAGEGTGIDRYVSGKEMEGAMVTSYFSAADYKDNSHKGMFLDQYRFGENTGLDQLLPGDEYYGTGKSDTVNTAGAWGTLDVQDPKAGSISGYVYEDFNNDGQFSSNENPIRNVLLNLYYKNTAGEYEWLSQTQSNANGYYEFTDIPGGRTYLVSETQPAGYADGKDTPGTSGGTSWEPDRISEIHIGANEHGTQYNFGEVKYASLTGYVYHDRNLDGSRGTGEEGITGVAVKVQVKNGDVYQDVEGQTARTDTDGKYRFDNLLPFQTYRIVEAEQPNGFTDGKESVGWIGTESNRTGQLPAADNDTIEAVFLGYDEHGQEYNFGEYKKGSISGYVYEDDNNDGVKDPGEKGIGGVEVWLCVLNENGEKVNVKKTLTGQDGSYYFDDLEPGQTYCVTEFDPDGYCDGKDTVGTINGTERGSINLEIPEGKDQIHDIYIGSDDNGINYNFAENLRGKISGYVYADADENGKKDTGEAGIGGVLVSLWVWDGEKYIQTSKSATTDGNGYYEFAGLCPFKKYQVRETQPADYNDGQETIGTLGGENSVNDIIGNIEMPPSGNGVNYNFGELVPPPLPPEPGSISGYVYLDADENGVKDSGETGIPGVVLTLQKLVDGQYVDTGRTAATNADGYYSFDDLTPNETYRVVETQPDGYDDGEETVGTLGGDKSANDIISAISVGEGQHGENYNFGELTPPPPPPVPGSISGYVYVDADENGVKDSGETGISGVVLTLQKLVGGQYIDAGRTAATDANGYYIFDDLTPNETYRVVETQPEDYDDGEETVGTLGGDKSANDIISAIPVGENEHGTDYNFGEWVKPVEPPPPYVPPPAPPVPAPPRMSGASGQPPAAAAPSWSAPYIGESLLAGYGGGGLPSGYSWHLSVVNAGYPRDADAGLADAGDIASKSRQTVQYNATTAGDTAHYVSVAWTPMPMNQSVWYVRDKSGRITRKAKFGPDGGIPLVGDFNGDGIADLAVFHNGNWYIDVNGNGEWDEEDLWCELGSSSDQPVVGDWDGDGKTDIAVFGPQWAGDAEVIEQEPGLPSVLNTAQTERSKNMRPNISVHNGKERSRAMKHTTQGTVRYDVIDHVFQYGSEGDKAFSGDFSGDGITKIGVYRNGKWLIDYNGNGRLDSEDIEKTQKSDNNAAIVTGGIPVVGDWNGDGIDKIGMYADGVWHLDTDGDFEFDTKIEFGEAGDMPIAGDFAGDGTTQLAVFRASSSDSLIASKMSKFAPTLASNGTPKNMPGEGPSPVAAATSPQVAGQYNANTGGTDDDTSNGQGTLPEQLQRHGRIKRAEHTNTPLHRHR